MDHAESSVKAKASGESRADDAITGWCGAVLYVVEPDVNNDACLDGSEEVAPPFPVDPLAHPWIREPYPSFDAVADFFWEPGDDGGRPDFTWYPRCRNWVCSERALRILQEVSGDDVNVICPGRLEGKSVYLAQAAVFTDLVDLENSIVSDGPFGNLEWPCFRRQDAERLARRVVRIPKKINMVCFGEDVRRALDAEGITGLTYVSVDLSD